MKYIVYVLLTIMFTAGVTAVNVKWKLVEKNWGYIPIFLVSLFTNYVMIFIKNMNLIFILPFVAIQFLLLILSLWDIKQKEVPVPTLYCLFLMCVVMAVTNPYCRIINNLVVGGVLSVALFILYKVASDKIGLGDVEIMLALGFAFGYPQIFSIIFSSLFLSMVFGILLMTVKKAKLKTTIPFVPFLFIGMTLNIINY